MKFFLKYITLILVIGTMTLYQASAQEQNFKLSPDTLNIEQNTTEKLTLIGTDINNLHGFSFTIDYDARYVSMGTNDIDTGDLFDGMSQDTHYVMEITESEVVSSCLSDSQAVAHRININLYLSNQDLSIDGTGSLLELSVHGDNLGSGEICINKDESSVDGDGISTEPTQVNVSQSADEVSLTVNLEGGKSTAQVETMQGSHTAQIQFTIAGNTESEIIDDSGVAQFKKASSYDIITITRPGYLKVSAEEVSSLPDSITLKAGDMNDDDVINILDLSAIAGKFNDSYSDTPSSVIEKMDYNNDKKVTISDLVLVAKNYGTEATNGF